jgi:hypothetical protein
MMEVFDPVSIARMEQVKTMLNKGECVHYEANEFDSFGPTFPPNEKIKIITRFYLVPMTE